MPRFILRFLFLCAVGAAYGAPFTPAPRSAPTAKEIAQGYREHSLLARPRAVYQSSIDDVESRQGLHVRRTFPGLAHLRVIDLDNADSADAAIARLRATGRYDFVEPDYLYHVQAEPNDPKYVDGSLWALKNTGQAGNVIGVAGADIGAVQAWDIIHDAPNVIVAVVDTGLNLTQQDVVDNLWTNPTPTIGDVHGANFVGGGGTIVSGDPTDDEGHGTHVAGTIGAAGNNGKASVGVAWHVKLMPVKVLGSDGYGNLSDIIGGLNYAINHGANIINASFGADTNTGFSQSQLTALSAGRDRGVILVAAAGNAAADLDVSRSYPASFAVDNIVTVGASNRRDEVSSFSNYGAAVDLFAPGEEIVSLDYSTTAGTVMYSGTSMATPHVSGALALLKAEFPTDTYRQLINRLLRGATKGARFNGNAQSGARLNLYGALTTTTNRPFNDDFADRPHFESGNLTIRSNNAGATAEGTDPAIAGFPATATLWWEWKAPSSGTVSVDTAGSAYDTVLGVFTGGTAGSLTPIASNDDSVNGNTSRVTFTATAGTTYQVAVGSKGGSGLTMLTLGTTPANDNFANAVDLSGPTASVKATNLNCSRESGEPKVLGFSGGNSLWYTWTAPRAGRFQVSALSVDFDPILAVYTGTSVSALTLVSASDNTGTDNAQTAALCTIDATAGTTYHISIDSKTASAVGQFTLTLVDSLWQFTTGQGVTASPAVADDGSVYFGGLDDSLYALAADGSQKWTVTTGGTVDTCSPAIADDGTIYFGSNDGKLYAISPDGTTKWTHDFNGTSSGIAAAYSPAIARDGTIYARATDGYLHALRASDGAEQWKVNIHSTTASFYGNPVIGADGTVYEGSDETDAKLYALNPDGTSKWTHGLDSGVYGAPALDADGNLYVVTLTGGVYSLTPSGAERWHVQSGDDISSSVALSADGKTMYYAGYDAYLYALDTATGAQRWRFKLGAEVRASSPAVDSTGVVYIGCYDGKLYAVNADGTLNRTYDTGDVIRSAPVLTGDRLYVGSSDQKLYAFSLPAGVSSGPWPQYRANARKLGRFNELAPAFLVQPNSQTAAVGSSLTLTVSATGQGPLSYQWRKNGAAINGANSATLTLTSVTELDAGDYSVMVTNAIGSVTSNKATVTIAAASAVGRIVNMSVLTKISSGESFTFGYYLGGAGTSGTKGLLMRAMGPSTSAYGVTDPLPDPALEFYNGTTLTAQNDNWSGDTAVQAAVTLLQAFPFASSTSTDAAVFQSGIPSGNVAHSLKVFGKGAGGTVLAEIYDGTPGDQFTASTPRLINVSLLKNVGAMTTMGFYIGGSTSVKVLVRASGPAIAAAPFSVQNTIADPKMAVYSTSDTSQPIATNDNWAGAAEIKTAADAVSAFTWSNNTSADAAVLLTLKPGGYTVQVTPVTAANTGVALIEVYEVP